MHWIIILSLVCGILPVMAVTAFSADEANTIDREVERRLARGEQANRLIKAQSPYLLQHSFNPVDWYPWGKEAFARAVAEDKPIFLSIGYSTCHWCHVMAHESFEDQETGRLLNTWFVSIKVDREERPDIDQMYMAATQAMTGSGGWPMSVFLLPDGSPFYAGTYFPQNATGGHPGFKDLLRAIHKAWLERRGDIQNSAERLVAALESDTAPSGSSIDEGAIDRCYSQLAASFDHRHGGFGKAPKFPRPSIISFLFSYFSATGKDRAKDMALQTLDNMAAGGIYDQLGGGFHRYSVDERWFVPHFEKMLYDQAQLLNVYLDAFQITGETKYRSIVEEMFRYLSRDMRNPAGGYYSAEDADSENPYDRKEHGEGAYYLWRADEIINILGKDDAALFMKYYGARDEGNVINDPMREFTGRNILFISSEGIGAPPEKIQAVLARAKEKLFTVRQLRNRPHLDDKVITSWNGMMMGALAKGSRLLNDPKMLNEAVHIASFIRESLFDVESGNLQRRFRRQVAGLPGQLDDYTNLVAGLLELYLASHDPKWLRWAVALTKKQIDLFWNEKGGFFYDSVIDPTVKIRMRDRHDGAEPAGNSVAALNLLNLGHLRNNFQWLKMAGRLMESYSETLNNYPTSLPLMLSAWQQMGSKGSQIVIAGQRGARETNTMLQIGYSAPTSLVLLADGGENQSYLAEKLPFLKNVARIDNKATAYFCRDFTCKLPVTDPVSLKLQIRDQSTQ